MQAFALQSFIESLGYTCNIIDHMGYAESHRKISLIDFSRANLLKLPYKFSLENGYRSFESFYTSYMKMGHRYSNYSELLHNPPDSDVFISGSDQVFNPRDAKLNRFLLEFVPVTKKRMSYAASIGDASIPEEKQFMYTENLEKFDTISVREKQAQAILSDLTSRPAQINCDPIFLLDKQKWESLEKPVSGLHPEFILCYMLYIPAWYEEWIYTFKRKTGLEVVCVGLDGYRRIYHDHYIRNAGPAEFLWLINHAKIVISSSFHGNAFSILFGKPLISILDPKRPDRIHNLLSLFGLEECEMYEDDSQLDICSYPYEPINRTIERIREESRKYLCENIEYRNSRNGSNE